MKEAIELETERLKLRQWKESDLPFFAELNADPVVMEYYPNTLTEAESDAMAYKRKWGQKYLIPILIINIPSLYRD